MTSLIKAFAKVAPKAVNLSMHVGLSVQFLSASLNLMTRDTRGGIDAATRKDLNTIRANNDSPKRAAWADRYEAAAGRRAALALAGAKM